VQSLYSKIQVFLSQNSQPLIVICGPTASGKTKLAVKLCKQFGGEVINADSRQIYDEIEIGNERTKPHEMEGIPHHLLAIVPPDHVMNIAEYKKLTEEKIAEIYSRNKIPFLVGGTGLYIDAVTKNYQVPGGDPDSAFRNEMEKYSTEELLEKLKKIDPNECKKLSIEKNKRFIVRALEIFHKTGKTKSELAKMNPPKYQTFKIAIEWPRDILYERINERTVIQVESGMLEEVKLLMDKYDRNLPAMTSIGCKEVIPFLENRISKDELIRTLQQNNRNYAKRQMTWFKRDKEVNWLNPGEV
jgi:tRNA dimethylallyltransferase